MNTLYMLRIGTNFSARSLNKSELRICFHNFILQLLLNYIFKVLLLSSVWAEWVADVD